MLSEGGCKPNQNIYANRNTAGVVVRIFKKFLAKTPLRRRLLAKNPYFCFAKVVAAPGSREATRRPGYGVPFWPLKGPKGRAVAWSAREGAVRRLGLF